MSLMAKPEPMFDDTDEDDTLNDTLNDTTLNDDDFLCSPTQKRSKDPDVSTIRRTQSLFQDPRELEQRFRGNDRLANSGIRTFKVSQDLLPRIDEDEMLRIVLGQHASQYDSFVIIDCRFPYEYDGGHIVNAVNISSQKDLEEQFVHNYTPDTATRLLIFHCEYSIFRGPTMASHLRKVDRIYNTDSYPYLLYPDVVVLEGGYKSFFDKYKEYCSPQDYVEMKDIKHKRTCEVEMNKVLQASKLTRARLFTQFQPHLTSHTRSTSFTALLSSDTSSTYSNNTVRRNRLSKIHKKESRRDLNKPFAQSLLNLNLESPTREFPSHIGDDFAPPPALFREYSKSLSVLLNSAHSSPLLVCSESYSSFSSSESLVDSPFADSDYFDGATANSAGSKLFSFPTSKSQYSFPSSNPMNNNSNTSRNKAVLTLRVNNHTPRSHHLALSSPTTSSPLTSTPTSTFESGGSNQTLSVMDAINDTPVDFAFNLKQVYREGRNRLLSYLGAFKSLSSLDIDEVDEETD